MVPKVAGIRTELPTSELLCSLGNAQTGENGYPILFAAEENSEISSNTTIPGI